MAHPLLRTVAVLTVSALMAACGGGGSEPAAEARTQAPSVAAKAVLATQRLTVTAATGGRVFSVPAGLDCGSACTADFEQGSSVSLRAVPAPGYVFTGWDGSCTDPAACSVAMTAARTVTARFTAVNPLAECTVTRSTATQPTFAAAHPRVLLANAELKACLQRQMSYASPAATRLKSYVDQQMAGGNIYGFEPWFAALVYQATGDTRYADYAVARTDAFVAAEEARIAAGQRAQVAGDSYLYVGEIIGGLAMVYDWAWDGMTAQQRSRWVTYANQAVWNVWNPSLASWGGVRYAWSGWSTNNPANNYYYSFLRATMLLGLATRGENAQADTWITRFRTDKIGNLLIPMFNSQLQGGGSREGTGYGTAMRGLWELYDLWERSTGERIATLTPHTRDSIAHLLHNITPTLDRLAPTGDHARDSTAALFDYHRQYLQTLIALFPQERLSAIAKAALDRSTVPRQRYSYDYYSDFLYAFPSLPAAQLSELSTAYWGPGTGQLMMRSGWDTAATFANFICGPYTESHAHRDQGSFVLFKGNWLAWDANIRSASGIEQGEENHNLVRLFRADGSAITQRAEVQPCRLLALAHNDHYSYAVADVTPIYGGAAGLTRIEREFLFIRPGTVVVMDRVVTSAAGTRKVWTLNLPVAPTLSAGRMQMSHGANRLDVYGLAPAGATGTWVAGSRVEVTDTTTGQSNFLHVLGTDGAVSQAVRDDAGGQIGTRITLADGRSVLVRFNGGTGGTLELRAANGALVLGGNLPSTVQAPALYAGDTPPPPPPALSVNIGSPADGSRYVAPASFEVAAAVSPADAVLRVELWRNGAKVAEDSSAPYAFAQSGLTGGSYRYEARAVRSDGAVSVSSAISVQVTDPALPPASVTLSSPTNGTQVNLGSAVTLNATVQGSVTLTRIDYLANASVVASRTASPWSASWTPPSAGTWTLQARATLADGRVLTSAGSSLTVLNVSTPPPPPPPAGTATVIRQGEGGYAGARDLSVSNQYVQYNGGKGVVGNDTVSGVYLISGSGGYEVRSFLRFGGLESLRGRRVVKAELALTFNFGATGYTLDGRYLALPWNPLAADFGWTRRDAGLNWAAPGSGGSDWVGGKSFAVAGFTGAAADTRTVLLDTAVVQGWIDQPASNFGLVLRPTVAGKVSWLRSSEDGTAAYRPTLRLWLE